MRDDVPMCTSAWDCPRDSPPDPFARGSIRPIPAWRQYTCTDPQRSRLRAIRMSDANPHPASAYASYPSLRNRAVVVTGGATGIGASIVAQFARQGARIALFDVQD